jgi:cytochrome c-type biogenesis protein CcmH
MTLWLILALMTAAAIAAVIWPLGRVGVRGRIGNDVAVYRDQLEEIERDLEAGSIGTAEAAAARVEVSRRLLAADGSETVATAAPVRAKRIAAVAVLVAMPVLAGGLYLRLGSPDLPGLPIAQRSTAPSGQQSIAALLERVEAHLDQSPDDGRGWELVAPVYLRLERYDDAVKARRNALRLLGPSADRESDLGEALLAAGNGVVTGDAKAAFDRAIALDARNVKARFFMGLAAEQDGKPADAARIWGGMIADAPAGAPWIGFVREALGRVDPAQAAAAPGPTGADMAAASEMSPDQRDQMIRSMVERLATKLKQDGSDAEGWLRLIRAYMVLGERDKARAAATDARGALAGEPDKLRRLDDGVKGMGLDG